MEELLLLRNKEVVYEVCNEINCICTWQMYCPFCGPILCVFVALSFVVQTKWSPCISFPKLKKAYRHALWVRGRRQRKVERRGW